MFRGPPGKCLGLAAWLCTHSILAGKHCPHRQNFLAAFQHICYTPEEDFWHGTHMHMHMYTRKHGNSGSRTSRKKQILQTRGRCCSLERETWREQRTLEMKSRKAGKSQTSKEALKNKVAQFSKNNEKGERRQKKNRRTRGSVWEAQ